MARHVDGYEDETLSAEEQAALDAHMRSPEVPPAEDDEQQNVAPAADPAPAKSEDAPAAEQPTDPTPANEPAPSAQADDERFAAFMAQHAGKTPEELARLAFQQTQRAASSGFQARQAQQTVDQVRSRLTEAQQRAEARRQKLVQDDAAFRQRLQDDPDGAAAELHARLQQSDRERIDHDEHLARVDTAIELARTAIPNFDQNYQQIRAFGSEMGYSPQEIDAISDGRDIVTLYLARLSGNLIKTGVMDVTGKMLKQPVPLQATDPRLNTPAPPTTLSSAPARAAGGATTEKQLEDLLNMSDDEFDKFVATNPTAYKALMLQAG